MWVYYHGKNQKTRDHEQIKKLLLNNPSVKTTIREIIDKELVSSALGEPRLLQTQITRSVEIIDRLAARLNYTKMRMLGYAMHKAYKNMYEKVIINKSGLNRVRELSDANNGNIVFCPTHRSYMDFLVVSYILYAHDIKVPHI
jgi:glycerone phosphate O-acyltransferase/fatty acyl-CoA reductase